MPVRDRRPGDDQPLFRAVNEQRLMGPVGGDQEETPSGAGGTQAPTQPERAPQQEDKGPIARAVDRAQENNWVYPSMANKAREVGLLDRADEVLDRVRNRLGGR